MARNILTNWWSVITALLGVAALTMSVAGAVIVGTGGGLQVVEVVAGLLSGGLVIGGLALLQRRFVSGSRMIVAGAVLTIIGLILIPIGALVVIGGLWTGHLQLSKTVDDSRLQPVRPKPTDITAQWHLFLVAAPVLFAVGLGALVVADVLSDGRTATGEDDTSLINGLAWVTMLFTWLSAIISAGLGVVLGAIRATVRHRTRPAGPSLTQRHP